MIQIASLLAGPANLMKIAPIHYQLQRSGIHHILIDIGLHTKTHGSAIFKELQLPAPTVNLDMNMHHTSYIENIKAIADRLARALKTFSPDVLLIYGDLDAVVAAAICATHQKIPLAHVEAGLRNHNVFDTEEINRIIADRFARWLFTLSESGMANLIAEGCSAERIYPVGNTIIDCLKLNLPHIRKNLLSEWGLRDIPYGICSFHREHNLNSKSRLEAIIEGVRRVQKQGKIVFLVYQETAEALSSYALEQTMRSMPNVMCFSRLGYLDYLTLLSGAKFVLTDSSGTQDETTYLGIPCFTFLEVTHRIDSINCGTNRLVDVDPATIEQYALEALHHNYHPKTLLPDLWDGNTASRIVNHLLRSL